MRKSRGPLRLFCLAFAVTACQQDLAGNSPGVKRQEANLAQTACGSCHAVGRYGLSPHPDAPSFAAIVNQEGLTAETLASWLQEAHNYPEEMQFTLEPHEVRDLVSYMLTLSDPNFRPPVQ
jgi:mono/diheme cytochrome c family protein